MPSDSVRCPSCGKSSPDENLRCIFCGELLAVRSGLIGRLRYGPGLRWVLVGVSLFLVWLLVRWAF